MCASGELFTTNSIEDSLVEIGLMYCIMISVPSEVRNFRKLNACTSSFRFRRLNR